MANADPAVQAALQGMMQHAAELRAKPREE
jgi:hypothetical protein